MAIFTNNNAVTYTMASATGATSLGLISQLANDYQAFFGILFGFIASGILIAAFYKNQKRQDAKFEELKRHNRELEKNTLKKTFGKRK